MTSEQARVTSGQDRVTSGQSWTCSTDEGLEAGGRNKARLPIGRRHSLGQLFKLKDILQKKLAKHVDRGPRLQKEKLSSGNSTEDNSSCGWRRIFRRRSCQMSQQLSSERDGPHLCLLFGG